MDREVVQAAPSQCIGRIPLACIGRIPLACRPMAASNNSNISPCTARVCVCVCVLRASGCHAAMLPYVLHTPGEWGWWLRALELAVQGVCDAARKLGVCSQAGGTHSP